MCEHVLVKIADRRERLLAQDASGDVRLAVLEALMTEEFARAAVLLATLVALEALLMQHEMIVQSAPVAELLAAQVTGILVHDFVIPFLMPPLVALHVFDRLAAETADLKLRRVRSLDMMRQIDLQFVTTAAVFANEP